MIFDPTGLPVTITLVDDSQRPVIENLGQLYRHDLSQFRGSMPNPDGTLRFARLPWFYDLPDHRSYLIHCGEHLAGFALTQPEAGGERSMFAFFIVRAARRNRIGFAAARQVLLAEPGPWWIAFQEENPGAARFWREVATSIAGADWREERRPVPPPAPQHLPPDVWLFLDSGKDVGTDE